MTAEVISTTALSASGPDGSFQLKQSRHRAAMRWRARCTPGMGVSVGVQVPCRRFTLMSHKIHENTYESKARASPGGEV